MRPAVNQVGKGNRDKQRRLCPAVWCEMPALLSCRFLEVERPRLSKVSRTLAFVYPYLFDSIPLFYRVGRALLRAAFPAPAPLLAAGLERSAASSRSENAQENSSTFIYLKKKGKQTPAGKEIWLFFPAPVKARHSLKAASHRVSGVGRGGQEAQGRGRLMGCLGTFCSPFFSRCCPPAQFYLCAVRGCAEPAVALHYKHTAFAFLTCFIFATHLPERLAPGHFDYIGECRQAH